MKNTTAFLAIAIVAKGTAVSTAKATITINGTSADDIIIIGMVKYKDDEVRLAYVCVDDGTSATWTQIGDSSGLDDMYAIDGGGGNDLISVVSDKNTSGVTTLCNDDAGNWYELLYNGNAIDLYGGAGADVLYDGGGVHDTITYGGDGNDTQFDESQNGYAVGGNGNDRLFGNVAGNYDNLAGNSGDDCLSFYDSSYVTALCGSGGESAGDSTTLSSLPADCEHHVTSC